MNVSNLSPARASAEVFIAYALGLGAIELLPNGRQLKSGRISPYFFNSGLFNTGESLTNLAKGYAATWEGMRCPEVIFGPAYKGIPLATATAQAMSSNSGYAFNRKEAKDHGEGGIIVDSSLVGKSVLIVDDVMTTGTSSGEAVEIIRANGGVPIGCVIAFDRQERSKDSANSAVQEFENNYGVPVRAVATLSDLIGFLSETSSSQHAEPEVRVILGKILAYKNEYGVTM